MHHFQETMAMSDALAATMQVFAEHLQGILADKLLSVVLFGSVVLGDFTPGKGDLDFLVAVQDELSDDDCACIFALHDRLRTGEMGALAVQLEGTYYPPALLRDPQHGAGRGCYIGTGRRGWRGVDSCQNSLMDYAIIRQYGVVSYGGDIRPFIYEPSRCELLDEISRNLAANITHAPSSNSPEYALAMFHWGARAVGYAVTGQLLSKTAAAEWYGATFPDDSWSRLVLHARAYRYPLAEHERAQVDSEIGAGVHGFLCHVESLLQKEGADSSCRTA